jgi:hypothetical protein
VMALSGIGPARLANQQERKPWSSGPTHERACRSSACQVAPKRRQGNHHGVGAMRRLSTRRRISSAAPGERDRPTGRPSSSPGDVDPPTTRPAESRPQPRRHPPSTRTGHAGREQADRIVDTPRSDRTGNDDRPLPAAARSPDPIAWLGRRLWWEDRLDQFLAARDRQVVTSDDTNPSGACDLASGHPGRGAAT